jgi:hypothetical protein
LTSLTDEPCGSRAARAKRARSSPASMSAVEVSGTSTTWSIPAAIRSRLRLVRCTSTAR